MPTMEQRFVCSHLAVVVKTGEYKCTCEQDYAANCIQDGWCPTVQYPNCCNLCGWPGAGEAAPNKVCYSKCPDTWPAERCKTCSPSEGCSGRGGCFVSKKDGVYPAYKKP